MSARLKHSIIRLNLILVWLGLFSNSDCQDAGAREIIIKVQIQMFGSEVAYIDQCKRIYMMGSVKFIINALGYVWSHNYAKTDHCL